MRGDRIAGSALVLIGLFFAWESWRLPLGSLRSPGPGLLPLALGLLLAGLGTLVAALGGGSPRLGALGWSEAPRAAAILGAGVFAALGLERLGYRLTMGLVLFFLLGVVERRHPALALALAAGLVLATFVLFDTVLRVPLPRGHLGL